MAINTVEDLYREILGREPDAEGLAYWQQGFGDSVDAAEKASFLQAASSELAKRTPAEREVLAPNFDSVADAKKAANAATAVANAQTAAEAKAASDALAKLTPEELITKQILAQNLTGKWSGEGKGSAEANAKDMAKIIADTGAKSIKDFGKVPIYAPVQEIGQFYNGAYVAKADLGDGVTRNVVYQGTGQYDYDGNEIQKLVEVPKDAKLTTQYGRADGMGELEPVDQSKLKTVDGKLVADTGQTTFGNVKTGQAVGNTYSERQTGDFFGGTFAGKGNTGYGVKFTPDGTPIFYTAGASSNDFAQLMQELGPLGNIALSAIGGPLAVGTMALLSGQKPEDVLKSTALSYLGNQAGSFVSGMEGITDILGDVGTNIASNAAKQFVGSGGQGVNAGKLLLGSGLLSGDGGVDGPNSADFEEGYFSPGGEGFNVLNSQSTDDFLKSIGINSVDELTDSGLSNADIFSLINGDYGDMSGLEDFVSAGDAAYTGEEGFTEDVNGGGYSEDAEGNISIGSGGGGSGGSGGGGGGTKTTNTTGNNVASTTNPVTKTTPATVTPTISPPRKIVDVFPKTTTTTPTPKISNVAKTVAGLVSGIKGAKAALPTAKTPTATNPAVDAITNLAQQQSQQQNQQNALLNLMGGKDELANIKSYKELYGNDLFGDTYVPPSASGSEAQGLEDEFFNGGHVDDLSIDALLHMLRN